MNINASDESNRATFNIDPIIPSNQYNKSNTYIDALYNPGSIQNVNFKVTNSGNTKAVIDVEANNATTSNGLVIDYSNSNNKLVNNPKFADLIVGSHKQKIELNVKESKIVTFRLNMPKDRFKGIILGGISAYLDNGNNSNNDASKGSGVSFSNRFVFSNPVVLRNEKGHAAPNIKYVKANQKSYNYSPAIMTTLNNNGRNFINDVKTETTIKNSNGKVITIHKTDMGSIAPSSEFDLPTPLNDTLSAGKYTVIGKITGNNNQIWNWKHTFTITNDDSNKVDKDVLKQPDPFQKFKKIIIVLIIAVFLTILVIIVLILLLLKKRKNDNK